MLIRAAGTKDIKDICELYPQLFSRMAQLQPRYFKETEQDPEFIRRIVESADSDVIIALEEGELAGFALVQELETKPYGLLVLHRYVFLLDLCVRDSCRGKGVAKSLIEEVKAWGKRRGLDYVELNVVPENENAIGLYKKEGFEFTVYNMRLTL